MSFDPLPSPRRAPDAERRERILEAAERAFAAHGFHAATMQHVAEAAGMSAGNLYRTFPSKEAIVEGLCWRDQQEQAADFAHLAGGKNIDIFAAVARGLKQHVAYRPRRKLTLFVEIWAEAARNPAIGAITRAMDKDALTKIEQAVAIAKACGEAAPAIDAQAVARLFFTYVGGLIKRLALEPDLDREAEADRAADLFKALCKGALAAAAQEAAQ
ncbi:MAG: TetR/AcrR family transcriptional regulator [Hyphomicrobiales bacterium]|nr:TetR/AcrR family transcriptional regulator [Hyphomicrobiales bacterium]